MEVSITIRVKNAASAAIAQVRRQLREFAAGMKEGAAEFGGLSGAVKAFRERINGLGQTLAKEIGPLGALFTFAGVAAGLNRLREAANELTGSMRRLQGAAALTGAPLDFIRDLARRGREEFSLDAVEANKYAAELTTLAAKTGDLGRAQGALRDFLNLGAAQGLNTAETLALLEQAADGSDRALKKFFNLKPDELFERFANSIGKTKDQLTDAERAQAILNAAQEKGAVVVNAYADFVNSAAGRQDDFGDRLKDTAATIGEQLAPMFDFLIRIGGLVLNVIQGIIVSAEVFGSVLGGVFVSVGEALGNFWAILNRVLARDFKGAWEIAKDATKEFQNTWAGVGDAIQESVDKAAGAAKAQEGYNEKALEAANALLKADIKDREEAEKKRKAQEAAAEAQKKAAEQAERELQALLEANREWEKRSKLQRGNTLLGGSPEDTSGRIGRTENFEEGFKQGQTAAAQGLSLAMQGVGGEQVGRAAEERVESFGESLKKMLLESAQEPLADFFKQGIDGFSDLGEAARDFGRAVLEALANIAATMAANAFLKALFPGFKAGGQVETEVAEAAEGGYISGPGGPTSDSIPAMLSDGEYVINAAAVRRVGVDALDYINGLGGRGIARPASFRFASGGVALAPPGGGNAPVLAPNVNVNVSAIDAKGVAEFMRDNRGALAGAVVDAMRSSSYLTHQMQGGGR